MSRIGITQKITKRAMISSVQPRDNLIALPPPRSDCVFWISSGNSKWSKNKNFENPV